MGHSLDEPDHLPLLLPRLSGRQQPQATSPLCLHDLLGPALRPSGRPRERLHRQDHRGETADGVPVSEPWPQWQKVGPNKYRHVRLRSAVVEWLDDGIGIGYLWHLSPGIPHLVSRPIGDSKRAFRRFNRILQGYDPLAIRLTNRYCLAWRIWLRGDPLPPIQ